MKILKKTEYHDKPFIAVPGQMVNVIFNNQIIASAPVEKEVTINTVVIFSLKKGEFGFKKGLGAMFGDMPKDKTT